MYDIVYESCPWHTRVAMFDANGRLLSVHYDEPERPFVEGAQLLGRVKKLVKTLKAAFVDIGDEVEAFLPLRTLPNEGKNLREGDEIMVRIAHPKTEDKGARVDGRVLESRPDRVEKIPCFVKHAPSALSRTLMGAGQEPVRVWVTHEHQAEEVLMKVPNERIFKLSEPAGLDLLERLDEQLMSLTDPIFPLDGGGNLVIESTKALTAIDVNSSGFKTEGKDYIEQLNLVAAKEVVRLVRLLDLGGSLVVDFLTLPHKVQRAKVRQLLVDQFAEYDDRKVEVMEMSRFGLLEINREKSGKSLACLVRAPLFVAGDICLQLFRQSGGKKAYVRAHPDVVAYLNKRLEPAYALALLGMECVFEADENYAPHRYSLSCL